MTRYFKFLWKRYAPTFTIILLMSSLVYGLGVKSQLDSFLERTYASMTLIALEKENPERFEQFSDVIGTSDYYSPGLDGTYYETAGEEKVQKELEWYNTNFNRLGKEQKKISLTKERIQEYKKDAVSFYRNYPEAQNYINSSASLEFIPMSDNFENEVNYSNRSAGYYENALEYDGIYLGRSHITMTIGALVFLGLFFALFLTSLEHMTKYKMFEQTIPLDGKWKYLTKLIFGMIWVLIYLILNGIIMAVLSRIIVGSAVDMVSIGGGYGQAGIQGLMAFALMLFVGSFTGNIVGHLAAMIPLTMGFVFFDMLYPFRGELWSILFANRTNLETRFFYPIIAPHSITTMSLSTNQLIVVFLIAAVLTVFAACFYKTAKYENSGRFFTIKWINILYYIFAVWTFASITALIATGIVESFVAAIVFIISAVFFAYIFRFLFKVRIGF